MNLTGLTLGLFVLVTIGLGFIWVIKLEYYVGAGVWKAVLVTGLVVCGVSLFMPNFTVSAQLGILGGSIVWGATELPAQAERVRRGMFPANPRRIQRKHEE
jgi:FtsH-binding integral membrane protein